MWKPPERKGANPSGGRLQPGRRAPSVGLLLGRLAPDVRVDDALRAEPPHKQRRSQANCSSGSAPRSFTHGAATRACGRGSTEWRLDSDAASS
jgi:hypothetical protein